ncbi:MAG: PKD domain-containing protein, partial [Bacteroidia bacterium]
KTTMDCGTPNVYNFTGTISDATSWTWDFGDGNVVPGSTASTISHTYTASGDYTAVLTAVSTTTGCSPSSYTVVIHVRNIKANFTYTSLLCSGTSYNFDASTSVDVNTSGYNGYVWFWNDGTSISITPGSITSHSYSATGSHTVTLIVRDINGCEDTLRKKLNVYGITPGFTPSKSPMCVNSVVTFSNTSVSDTTIISYNWSFGDPAGGTSTQINPTYTYNITNPAVNSVTVSVVVTNTLGCTATYTLAIPISRPSAVFSITSSRNICLGAGVTFTSLNSYPNMTWAYGDGTTLGPTPPTTVTSHTYLTSGIYTTTLSVTDAAGCSDVKTIAQTVNVQDYPVINISCPGFGVPQCRPHQFVYTDNTVLPAGVFLSRTWNLYTGSASITGSVVTSPTYTTPGTYSVTLTETTTNNCVSTLTKTVSVIGPVANFTLTPSIICKGQSITFGITDTTDVASWHWDFGDGTDTNAVSPISHQYNYHPPNATGTTNVQLVYYSAGLTCPQTQTYTVSIRQVIADFDRNLNHELFKTDTAHCLGSTDTFTNTSTGADTYGWSFGNGVTSSSYSPTYQYTVAGTYSVQLHITNTASGCVDTLIKIMIIYPPFNVTATGDSICQGNNAQLNASTAVSYSWSAPSLPNPASVASPTVSPNVTTTYTLVAADINGCTDTDTALVFVQQPAIPVADSYTIVIGQTVVLQGNQGPGFTYTWTPTDNLSCIHCPEPVYSGTVNASFVELISDVRNCFTNQSTFEVVVEPLSSLDVPTAFTPNGDGTNDIVYVGGWGLKSLNYFRIYNRWGELVFESNDLKVGWDGMYKGTPQNIETYVYQASANTYISKEPITKKGYIKLLR